MRDLAEAGAALLGGTVEEVGSLGGGLSRIALVTLADGRQVVVKDGPAPRLETEMLEAIAASGAPAPAVLAVSDAVLVIEKLPSGGGSDASAALGEAVAVLHATTGERYGWHADYAFGPVAIENAPLDDWPAFFGERRLLAQVPQMPPDLGRRTDALAADLANRLPQSPPASLLHGDLWGGNIVCAGETVSGLVDPACYFGHGEVDLAMLALFGSPGSRFFDAYGSLEAGHQERRAIYQLWPAINHLRLFGNSYRPMVDRLLSAAGV